MCLRLVYEVSTVYRLRSEAAAVSVLHGGGELEVGDANVVVAAVQENVGLRGRGGKQGGVHEQSFQVHWISS